MKLDPFEQVADDIDRQELEMTGRATPTILRYDNEPLVMMDRQPPFEVNELTGEDDDFMIVRVRDLISFALAHYWSFDRHQKRRRWN